MTKHIIANFEQIKKISIEYDDVTTHLVYDADRKYWTRIVNGKNCFACTTMTLEDMETQLKTLLETVRHNV